MSIAGRVPARLVVLLAILLVIGFGSLGQFPMYYAFTQELSVSRMGTGHRQSELPHLDLDGPRPGADRPLGRPDPFVFRRSRSLAGLMPLIGFLALLLLWNARGEQRRRKLTRPRIHEMSHDPSTLYSMARRSLGMVLVLRTAARAAQGPVARRARRARSRRRSCWPTRS